MRGKILCAGTHNKSSRKFMHERRRLEVHVGSRSVGIRVHPVYLLVTCSALKACESSTVGPFSRPPDISEGCLAMYLGLHRWPEITND